MNFFNCEQMNGRYGKIFNNLFDQTYKPLNKKGGLTRLGNKADGGFSAMSEEE